MKLKSNKNIISFSMALLITVVLCTSVWAERCVIRIRAGVELDGGVICLSEVADVTATEPGMKDRLDSLILVEATAITDERQEVSERSIGLYEISRTLMQAGINPAMVDIYGASDCRIVLKHIEPVEESGSPSVFQEQPIIDDSDPAEKSKTLADELRQMVVDSTGIEDGRLIIEWESGDADILAQSAGEDRFSIKPRCSLGLGQVRFDVLDTGLQTPEITSNGLKRRAVRPIRIKGDVRYQCVSVSAARNLFPGDVITDDDIILTPRQVSSLNDLGIEDKQVVLGQEASRRIRAGQLILPTMLRKLLLVRRKDDVEVSSQVGLVKIILQGKALGDGGLGDTISVRNETNGNVIRGKVTGTRFVTAVGEEPNAGSN